MSEIDTSIFVPLEIVKGSEVYQAPAQPLATRPGLAPHIARRLLDAFITYTANREGLQYDQALTRLQETEPALFQELYQAAYRKR